MPRRNPNRPDSVVQAFENVRADYDAARASRFERRRNVPAMGAGADYHYRNEADWLRMLEYARDMDRNDAIVGATIDRATTNILLGTDGIRPDPQTGDESLDQTLREAWRAWAEDGDTCDVSGENAWADIEELTLRQTFVDGDAFVLAPDGDKLQLIEGHRCRTPQSAARSKREIVHGVELDGLRKPLRYYFTRENIDPRGHVKTFNDVASYAARDETGLRRVFHMRTIRRSSQTRGISALTPIFKTLAAFEDVNFAKLIQQQIVSCFAIFRSLEIGAEDGPADVRGERTTSTHADGATRLLEGIAPGMEVFGRPGEKLQGFSPNVPNPEYFQHVRLILQLIGINLGLPLVLVLLDASETNFSGWRGAIEEARKGFRKIQGSLIRRLHRPVWRWRVSDLMRRDPAIARAAGYDIDADGNVTPGKRASTIDPFRHRWNPPAWPYIQPLQDAGTDLLRMRNGLISPRRLHAERNRDHAEISREIAEDNQRAIREAKMRAAELNREFQDDPNPVHWREIISLPTPDGVRLTLNTGGDGDTADAPERRNNGNPGK